MEIKAVRFIITIIIISSGPWNIHLYSLHTFSFTPLSNFLPAPFNGYKYYANVYKYGEVTLKQPSH
jgi:hypothetical protein